MFDDKVTKLRKEQFVEAESVAYLIKDEQKRKLAFLNTCALFAFKNYIEKNKYSQEPVTNSNLFRVPVAVEKYEIFDLYLGNVRLDVRVSLDGKYFPIPKCHIKKSLAADFYVVYKRTKNPLKCESVGFIKKEDLIFDSQDDNYYYISNSILNPIKELKQAVILYVKEQKIFFSTEHRLATENFVAFLDGALDEIKSLDLIEHLLACSDCRGKFVEYSFLEDVLTAVRHYPELKKETELALNLIQSETEESHEIEQQDTDVLSHEEEKNNEELQTETTIENTAENTQDQEPAEKFNNEAELSETKNEETDNTESAIPTPILAVPPTQPQIESIASVLEQSPIAEFIENKTADNEESSKTEEPVNEFSSNKIEDNFEINETDEAKELNELEENEKQEELKEGEKTENPEDIDTIKDNIENPSENTQTSQEYINQNETPKAQETDNEPSLVSDSESKQEENNEEFENDKAENTSKQQENTEVVAQTDMPENTEHVRERHIPPVEFEEYPNEDEQSKEDVVDLSKADFKEDNTTWVAEDEKYDIVENIQPESVLPSESADTTSQVDINESSQHEQKKTVESISQSHQNISSNSQIVQPKEINNENNTNQFDIYANSKIELNPIITFETPKETYEEEKKILYSSAESENNEETTISDMKIESSIFESSELNSEGSLDINMAEENLSLDLVEGQSQTANSEVVLDISQGEMKNIQNPIEYEHIASIDQKQNNMFSGLETPFNTAPPVNSEISGKSSWSSLYNVNSNSDNSDSSKIIGSQNAGNIEYSQSALTANEMFTPMENAPSQTQMAENSQIQGFPESDMPMNDSEISTLYDRNQSLINNDVNENHFTNEIETSAGKQKKVTDSSKVLIFTLLVVSIGLGGILIASRPASESDTDKMPNYSYESETDGVSDNMDKVMTDAFSDGQQTVSVSKMQWQKDVESTPELKEYMNDVASSVWDDLDISLGSVQGYVASAPSKIVISITNKGEIQDVRIGKSCGSKEIDEVILQSVKKVVATMPPSTYSISGKKMNLILVVNF